jgi:CHAT domain-containing protein
VDDRSVARLMERFYQALAAGGTAGAALRAAQNALRREPETAHPYHWAGFVVYGAPDARLRLGAPPARRSR